MVLPISAGADIYTEPVVLASMMMASASLASIYDQEIDMNIVYGLLLVGAIVLTIMVVEAVMAEPDSTTT
jgi:hypothetical protein